MKSIAVIIILLLLLASLSNAAGKRKAGKGRKRGKLTKIVHLNSALKGNSNQTATNNGTTAPTPTADNRKAEITTLKKKSVLLAKKLNSCQGKVKQARTCRQRMDRKTKEMDKVVQEGHMMKREMTSLEQKVIGLKEVLRKEKAAAEIILHERLSEMKVSYQDKVTYLETVVAGLNYSLVFHQENAKKMAKVMKASAKTRLSHLRSRFNSKISNLESTIEILNKTMKKIGKDHNVCVSKFNRGGPMVPPSSINTGKSPRTLPAIPNHPKSRPERNRSKKPNRVTMSQSLTPTATPTTQSIDHHTSSNVVTSSDEITSAYDETTLNEETTIYATTYLKMKDDDVTTDLMTTVDITTDFMTSDYVTTDLLTSDISASGDSQDQPDDVIMKMM